MKDFNLKSIITNQKDEKNILDLNENIKKVKTLFCAEFYADYFNKKILHYHLYCID